MATAHHLFPWIPVSGRSGWCVVLALLAGRAALANQPPVADAGPFQRVMWGQLVHLDASASTDPDGDPLTYRWSITMTPPAGTAEVSDAQAVNPVFRHDVAGWYELTLEVFDGQAWSLPDTVHIDVRPIRPVDSAYANVTYLTGCYDDVAMDKHGGWMVGTSNYYGTEDVMVFTDHWIPTAVGRYAQRAADISGWRVLYHDEKDEGLWCYDFRNGSRWRVSGNAGDSWYGNTHGDFRGYAALISGDNIVYQARPFPSRPTEWHWHNLATGLDQLLPTVYGGLADLDGNLLAWEEGSYPRDVVAMYLGGEKFLVAHNGGGSRPSVWGNQIAYVDDSGDVMIYDCATGLRTRVTEDDCQRSNVRLWGYFVYFDEIRGGDWQVLMHDLTSDYSRGF